jgi:hypothetical protein
MSLHPHEEAIIRAFFASAKRERYLTLFAKPKGRAKALRKLNHAHFFDPRYAIELPTMTDVLLLLRSKGAPETCHVISDSARLDGQDMPLAEALPMAEIEMSGTLIGCIPGQLGYYYGEAGEQRLLLEKKTR